MRLESQSIRLHRGELLLLFFYNLFKLGKETGMKLSETIEQVKREKPHSFSMNHCTLFINEVESSVQEFLGVPILERKRYEWEKDGDINLIAPDPYSALYISYLKARIDYSMEEYESYSNNQAQFESDFEDFKAWAIRKGQIKKTLPDKFVNWW